MRRVAHILPKRRGDSAQRGVHSPKGRGVTLRRVVYIPQGVPQGVPGVHTSGCTSGCDRYIPQGVPWWVSFLRVYHGGYLLGVPWWVSLGVPQSVYTLGCTSVGVYPRVYRVVYAGYIHQGMYRVVYAG